MAELLYTMGFGILGFFAGVAGAVGGISFSSGTSDNAGPMALIALIGGSVIGVLLSVGASLYLSIWGALAVTLGAGLLATALFNDKANPFVSYR